MTLQILSSPPPDPEIVAGQLRERIEAAFPEAEVAVVAQSPGHFTVSVVCASFEGESRVRQQQRVYAAIGELMAGDAAPVHAIDQMVTRTP